MFRTADVVLLNKTDLLPYVDFDATTFGHAMTEVNPAAEALTVSATRGDGLPGWYEWLSRAGTARRTT